MHLRLNSVNAVTLNQLQPRLMDSLQEANRSSSARKQMKKHKTEAVGALTA